MHKALRQGRTLTGALKELQSSWSRKKGLQDETREKATIQQVWI